MRIAMYAIYDKDGILDNFCKYYLTKLRKVCDAIVGVVSGTLTPESREELEELTDDFLFGRIKVYWRGVGSTALTTSVGINWQSTMNC